MLVCKKTTITIRFALLQRFVCAEHPEAGTSGVADAGVMKYNGKYYIGGSVQRFLCIR